MNLFTKQPHIENKLKKKKENKLTVTKGEVGNKLA